MVYREYGRGTMKRIGFVDRSFAIGVAARPTAREAARVAPAEQSSAAAWFWAVSLAVVVWSVSYLIRQPGVATSALSHPFSPVGDFALEGMLLALSWLGVLVAACLAVLTGAARIVER